MKKSVAALSELLHHEDTAVAKAAACALGNVGTTMAAGALADTVPTVPGVRQAVTDALLTSAERLVAAGDKPKALEIYTGLAKGDQPKHVRLAATRGMLVCRS